LVKRAGRRFSSFEGVTKIFYNPWLIDAAGRILWVRDLISDE